MDAPACACCRTACARMRPCARTRTRSTKTRVRVRGALCQPLAGSPVEVVRGGKRDEPHVGRWGGPLLQDSLVVVGPVALPRGGRGKGRDGAGQGWGVGVWGPERGRVTGLAWPAGEARPQVRRTCQAAAAAAAAAAACACGCLGAFLPTYTCACVFALYMLVRARVWVWVGVRLTTVHLLWSRQRGSSFMTPISSAKPGPAVGTACGRAKACRRDGQGRRGDTGAWHTRVCACVHCMQHL